MQKPFEAISRQIVDGIFPGTEGYAIGRPSMRINLDCSRMTHACVNVVKAIRPNILILATFVFVIELALDFRSGSIDR